MGGTIQSYLALYGKKVLDTRSNISLRHPNQQSPKSIVFFVRQWVFHISVEICWHVLAQLIGFSNSEGFSSTSGLLRVMPQHFIQIVGLPLGHFKTLLFFVFFKPFRSWLFDVVLTVAVLQDQNWLQFEVKKWWPKILPQILSGKEYNSWSHESQRVIPFLE